jgi:uncharacterized protein (DUF1499 family)
MTDADPTIDAPQPLAPGHARWLAPFALGVAVLAGLLVLFAGPGTRSGWWDFRTGFAVFRYGAYLGILGTILAVAALAVRRHHGRLAMAVAALLIALPAAFLPWQARRSARGFPAIHDITTDTQNPPAFVRLGREPSEDGNGNAYEGEAVASQQRQAYPDLRPAMMAMTVDSAFTVAYQTARDMGWEVVEAEPGEGRIEATATTRWFGFKDDIVIRVRPASGIARIDVRSASRVGRGDAGANAARVRAYLQRLPGRVEM